MAAQTSLGAAKYLDHVFSSSMTGGASMRAPSATESTRSFRGASGPGGQSYALLVMCAGEVQTVKLVPRRAYTIGRDPTCDVVLEDFTVSRFHAQVTMCDGEVAVTDLGSSNGTIVGGEYLGQGQSAKLSVGITVEVGSSSLLLQQVRSPALPSSEQERSRVKHVPLSAGVSADRVVVDPAMRDLYATIDVVAPSQIAVLVLGETGVGKEVIAEEVHRRSRRASAPFIAMNCAALPDSILEAELFGYERGAFTGANQAKVGLFEAAHGGTIFLDEIGDMPISTQAKVLRVLESGEILRLGSVKPRTVDVRFIAATNRDIPKMIAVGQFRADLFFRLNGVMLSVPSLRRRPLEILPFAKMFLELAAKRHGREVPMLSQDAADYLMESSWPGNVRQLKNTIERAVVMCNGSLLRAEHLGRDAMLDSHSPEPPPSFSVPDSSTTQPLRREMFEAWAGESETGIAKSTLPCPSIPPANDATGGLPTELKAIERERIVRALSQFGGNQTQAARFLKMSRTTLIARIREYNLVRPRKPTR